MNSAVVFPWLWRLGMPLEMGLGDRAFLRGKRPTLGPGGDTVRVVDLFSGCGGLTLGVEEAARQARSRLDVRLAVEQDPWIAAAYEKNFAPLNGAGPGRVEQWFDGVPGKGLSLTERRVRKQVGAVDILVGGPPCTGHSTLNNHTRGDDPKNGLYLIMVRAAEVLRPTSLIIENVPALERDANGTLAHAIELLMQLDYKVDTGVVRVAEIGVPQLRKRLVLLAHRATNPSVAAAIDIGRVRRTRSLRWAIGDLLRCEGYSIFGTASVLSPSNLKRARYLLEQDEYDLPNRRRPKCQRGAHKYKSMYGRLDWRQPAQTITTGFGSPGQGRYLHPELPRTLTPKEAARVQFFPDWYDFSPIPHRRALSEAIGNAVPPKLAFVLASHLLGLKANAGVDAKAGLGCVRNRVGRTG